MRAPDGWPAVSIINSGALEDREPAVRLAAIDALAQTAQAVHAQRLYERLDPAAEAVPEVREAAWNALVALFPREFDIPQLNAWADRFRDQPERRLTILVALRNKLIERRLDTELAVVRQNIGEEYLRLNQYSSAAVEFRAALDAPGREI